MNILFHTYPRIGLASGGLQNQIHMTRAALQARGVLVRLHNTWEDIPAETAVVHCFALDSANLYAAERARQLGIPVVLSTVANLFHLTRTGILMRRAGSRMPALWSDWSRATLLCRSATRVVVLNELEQKLVESAFKVPRKRIVIVPNGIGENFTDPDTDLFRRTFRIEGPYVLQVGSIEPRKNQLHVLDALAMLHSDITYVSVGKQSASAGRYSEKVLRHKYKNKLFIEQIENSGPLLPSAYAGASVFVLPSYSEVMPLVLYEAIASGANVVVSERVPVDPPFRSRVKATFDPGCKRSIAKALTLGLSASRNELPSAPEVPRWPSVARQLEGIYSELLSS